jgi:hypothetical protein
LPIRVLIHKGGTRTTREITHQFDVTVQDLQAEYTVGLDLTDKNQHVLIKPKKNANEPAINPNTPIRIQEPPKPGKVINSEETDAKPLRTTRDEDGNPAHPSNEARPEHEVNQDDPHPRSGDAPTATPGTQESN